MRRDEHGPAWLGIGSMRSGTTWLTSMLCQHHEMSLATNGRKEQWLLNRVATGDYSAERYRSLFPADGQLRGEWSPRYMWLLHTATAAISCLPKTTPILVSLRDPIERYASHQRFSALRRAADPQAKWKPAISAGLGTFIGMYADQLVPWKRAVGAERLMLFTYEAALRQPATICANIWKRLGLETAPALQHPDRPSPMTSTGANWTWPSGLRETLVKLYTPQVQMLQDSWELDISLWPNFEHLRS